MPQLRAATSAGVGRQLLPACSIDACPLNIALTVMLARLLALRSSSQILRKEEAASSLDMYHHKALLISNPKEKVSAS